MIPAGDVTFVLVHSPLVGPVTWEPAAAALRSRGHRAVVPSLLDTLRSGPPYVGPQVDAVVAAVRAAATGSTDEGYVVVGHSGAGPLLPAVGAALRGLYPGGVRAYLFVDAAPPRPGRSWWEVAPPQLVRTIEGMTRNGWAPPWHQWFPPEVIAQEVPDQAGRERLVAELRPLPVAMFREPAPVVPGWPDAPCGYLQLSPAYAEYHAWADERGWRTASLDARHLTLYADPALVVDVMFGLLC